MSGSSVDPASSHNLIGTGGGGLVNGTNGNQVGVDVATVLNPPLADNDGPTKTHALIAGSPALDAGDDSYVLDPLGNPLAADQRGLERSNGAAVDIGTYEVQQI